MGYKGRDVEVVDISDGKCLVVACDSCGGIGSKQLDEVKVDPYVSGRHTTRVALMEVMSVGASPKNISVAISNEPVPTGESIIKGVKDELKSAGYPNLSMAISTEKNIPTRQTGIGITVVGICSRVKLRVGMSKRGDFIYCLGAPKVGYEVVNSDEGEIVNAKLIRKLLDTNAIHDILPIGSKGILKEAAMLGQSIGCNVDVFLSADIDMHKSAGPSTCLIFTTSFKFDTETLYGYPMTFIGRII